MDGPVCAAVVSSSIVVAGAIAGGFWRVMVKIGHQEKSIGRLEGKVDGMSTSTMLVQRQIEGLDKRVGHLDERINGLVNSRRKN